LVQATSRVILSYKHHMTEKISLIPNMSITEYHLRCRLNQIAFHRSIYIFILNSLYESRVSTKQHLSRDMLRNMLGHFFKQRCLSTHLLMYVVCELATSHAAV
jgi:hypothetical protein